MRIKHLPALLLPLSVVLSLKAEEDLGTLVFSDEFERSERS